MAIDNKGGMLSPWRQRGRAIIPQGKDSTRMKDRQRVALYVGIENLGPETEAAVEAFLIKLNAATQ